MTLVEIMMVIGIIGITLTFGVPSMVSMVDDMRLSSTSNDYLGFLNVARSEAGKRGARVTVCASSAAGNYAACSAATSTDWAVGAVAFIDTNSDGVVDASETVVRVLDAQPAGLTIVGGTTTGGASAGRFLYKPSGASDSARTFAVCKTGRNRRDISVSLQGRAAVQTSTSVCP